MKYLFIITIFIASCSKNVCYECIKNESETNICEGDPLYDSVKTQQKMNAASGNINQSTYYKVNQNTSCKFKD